MTEEDIDRHLDSVLRAAGSGLRHYSLPGVLAAMRKAMRDAVEEACREQGLSLGPDLKRKEPNRG